MALDTLSKEFKGDNSAPLDTSCSVTLLLNMESGAGNQGHGNSVHWRGGLWEMSGARLNAKQQQNCNSQVIERSLQSSRNKK